MNLSNRQITFLKPHTISAGINEGIRALAENYDGNMQRATDHCLLRVQGLTEARLTRSRAKNPPRYTRDGQSFITLLWVLLADGLLPHRQIQTVRTWLHRILDATDLFEHSLTNDDLSVVVEVFSHSIAFHHDTMAPESKEIAQTLTRIWTATESNGTDDMRLMPLLNRIFIGREADIQAVYQRLGIENMSLYRPLTIVRGWPGVGKTAFINTIAHDEKVKTAFEDGLLWAYLGRNGDVFGMFKSWAKQLGALHLLNLKKDKDLIDGLRMLLSDRQILIIVDDIWTEAQGNYVRQIVDLSANTVLLTTRFTDIAARLVDLPDDIYVLDSLNEKYAIELLSILAPEPVQLYEHRMPQLVKALEGLPLALRVAGPTLQHYHIMNFDIEELLDEFENDYNRLLDSPAPGDRFDVETGQTPTIELLFKRSVETLTDEARLAFAALGVFRFKPSTFDADALRSVWETTEPRNMIMTLVGRGLMDTTRDGRYHIHQTLHMYANKLLDDYSEGHLI